MKRVFKNRLFNNALIFTLSTVLNKGMNFFILPVLTFYLTKEDYGHLGFIVSVVAIASIYMGLWPPNFIMAKFSSFGKKKMSYYLCNIFIILFICFFVVFLFLWVSEDIFFENFDQSFKLIVLICFYTLFMVVFNIFNTIVQLEKNAVKYALFQSFYLFCSLAIALVLIIGFHFDWHGKFYAELFILFLISVYALYYFIKEEYLRFDFDISKIKTLVFYLFPMTFHVIGLFMMGTIDKVFLAKYLNLEAVGVYTIAMTMSIIVNIVYDSAIKAWEPYFFEKISTNNKNDQKFIIKTVAIYWGFVILAAYMYLLTIPTVFSIMIDEKFDSSLQYIPLLVTGFVFEGLRKPLASFLMHKNLVKTLAITSLFAAGVNIVLNIVLIQKYGISGAAYATIFSFAVLYFTTLFLVYRHYPELRRNKNR